MLRFVGVELDQGSCAGVNAAIHGGRACWLRLGTYVSVVMDEAWMGDSVAVYRDGDLVKVHPGDCVVRYMGVEAAAPLRDHMGEWDGPLKELSLS